MKPIDKTISHIFLFIIVTCALPASIFGQDKKAATKAMIDSRHFTFHAQTAIPLSGRSKQLTTEYYLTVLGDSIVSELPYYGRAYSAGYGTNEGGFSFTTTKFEYTSTPTKKGGWDITIKPKDQKDLRQFSLSVSATGYGNLQALSNNRQPISYHGYISAVK